MERGGWQTKVGLLTDNTKDDLKLPTDDGSLHSASDFRPLPASLMDAVVFDAEVLCPGNVACSGRKTVCPTHTCNQVSLECPRMLLVAQHPNRTQMLLPTLLQKMFGPDLWHVVRCWEVLCSAWKDDGSTVFSGGCDKQVKMWLLGGNQPQTVAMHDMPVSFADALCSSRLLTRDRVIAAARFIEKDHCTIRYLRGDGSVGILIRLDRKRNRS